ncbi:putative SOS response-associated peptidase YedK [Salirhabdus euzebyi]|uniref:Abasic site processing protein n=1 Tax=Salirhabdus euzebyi TaxID=394506 RepID=A0A841QAD2_9BACI|nr:SOS response-associated peptidase [Salirhabdus euzebyi]MBB6455370.1 putative SOS response-associated peptidase YedK [Salirhabdus euzebyi]
MCGRFTLLAEELEILEAFGIAHRIEDYEPRYNIAPGQNILAIVHDGEQNRAGYLKWGLVPSWAKDESIGYKMINARTETAAEKPSFKRLMERRRCLVVADSFYEWKKVDKQKQPLRISLKNRQLFAFAGLWDRWKKGDKEIVSCTILTKEPNDFMSGIHNRMPVILPKDQEMEWIKNEDYHPEERKEFLLSLPDDPFTAYEVSTYVNNAKNEGASCVAPLTME